MKNKSISFGNKLFDLEARLDYDFETGQMFWVIFELGPDTLFGRRWIWQFYAHVPLFHFSIGDRNRFR